MASALSTDGKYLLVLNGGYKPPSISVLRVDTMEETSRTPVADGWLGLTFSPDGKFVYVGGGSRAACSSSTWADGKLDTGAHTSRSFPKTSGRHTDFIGDVAVSPDGRMIYAAGLYHDAIHVINLQSGRVIEKFETGRRPYRILFHPDGKSYFVSSWADGSVYHHNADNGRALGSFGSGSIRPIWSGARARRTRTMKSRRNGPARLFVAAANTNNVYVVGVTESKDLKMIESINVAMTARQPLGMTPSALAMNADRIAVCSSSAPMRMPSRSRISRKQSSAFSGSFPPAGIRRPCASLADGRLVVLNGRGLRSSRESEGSESDRAARSAASRAARRGICRPAADRVRPPSSIRSTTSSSTTTRRPC